MSNDLISRSELKKAIEKYKPTSSVKSLFLDGVHCMFMNCIAEINNAPTVTFTEWPQGKWIKEDDEHLKGWYRCSECGRRVEDLTDDVVIHAGCEDYTIADIYPYCHCGADMRGGGTNE